MIYKIVISEIALRELYKLPPKINKQISTQVDTLALNPRPQGCKKLKAEKDILWRIRVGDYRVIYAIEDKIKIVQVRKIGHRKNIYS